MSSTTAVRRALMAAVLAAASLSWSPAPHAVAANPSLAAYRGLGAWVDIYDDAGWADPEGTVADLAAKRVRTLYLETCNYGCSTDLFRPGRMGRFLRAAHGAGMKVVAWYLPGFDDLSRDRRRSRLAIQFKTNDGHRFDSFALDIEARLVTPAEKRNQRILTLSRRIRELAGPSYPLGAITPPYFYHWGGPFPYRELTRDYNVFLPMAYFTGRVDGPRAAHDEVVRNVNTIRRQAGRRTVPIHVIAGIADGLTGRETRAAVRAGRERGVLGFSLYDHFTSGPEDYRHLKRVPVNPRQRPVMPLSLPADAALGNLPDGDRSHPKEVWYRIGGREGRWRFRARVFDVQEGEVTLYVNWKRVGDLRPTADGSWQGRGLTVPPRFLRSPGPNVIGLVAAGNHPGWSVWGVRKARLARL
jgi:hypothetical protein